MKTDLITWLEWATHDLDTEDKLTWAAKFVQLRLIFFRKYQQNLVFSTVLGAEFFHILLKLLKEGGDMPEAVNYTRNINVWLAWARTRTVDLALGYESIESAPEDKEIYVQWGSVGNRPEYGTALRLGQQWYITSESNPHANHRQCAAPTGWHRSPTL